MGARAEVPAPVGLDGRRALVTGAASGIGLATATMLRAAGARVFMTDVHAGVHDKAGQIGAEAQVADLTDGAAITVLVADAARALGGLDAVVNCAGVHSPAALADLDRESWDRTLAVNLTAPYEVCRAALPFLRENPDASIVNIASGMGLLPDTPGSSAYAASKGGLIAFTRAMAAELAPGIRVNAVSPGLTRTPMTDPLLEAQPSAAVQRYALRRAAEPAEIASAICYLTSAAASFVTGATLAVDGGRTFH